MKNADVAGTIHRNMHRILIQESYDILLRCDIYIAKRNITARCMFFFFFINFLYFHT